MDHNDIRHKLSHYLDGSVTAEERSSIEEHLKTCTACSDALRELKKTIEHIKSVEEIEPPAWMMQKIMAKVRAEDEKRKGLLHRLFFPLKIKLPIQAVAVIFLAVTAFYVHQSIRPSPQLSEVPVQESVATTESSTAGSSRGEQKITRQAPPNTKRVPQSPDYKALDMKYAYEKPAPPVAMDKAAEPAPIPGKPAEQPMLAKEEDVSEKRAAMPQAGAPAVVGETELSSGSRTRREARPETAAPALTSKAKSTFDIGSYADFIGTIKRYPYDAPATKKRLILNNFHKLHVGMTKDEVSSVIGDPDYSTDLAQTDRPYRQPGTYWTYSLHMNQPKIADEQTDEYVEVFFDVHDKAYWFVPVNIQGLKEKGGTRESPK